MASGINQVERDGISFTHTASYTVLGTMNREEGDLQTIYLTALECMLKLKAKKILSSV